MFLKSIEVHGFKAFANKIRFEFSKGITGIVGPNGSGKSNVADAVRWVLGEQSPKQLRGSSMQDVIFAGTESRKPMGYAYVTLTLDNTDHWLPIEYEEVTVGRRVYRSGESEYLINGSVCRLRDVQELFFDTGVGKEGYSIIGQGQIDKILSGKPEERREIFDEAAGITKYKKRRATAERDLEAERNNLSRVTDIVTEIGQRLGPLEKQDEKARVYLKLKEELKHLEVNQFLLEYERSEKQRQELNSKWQIASEDLSDTRQEYEKAKEEYDRLLTKLEQLQAALGEARELRSEKLLLIEKYAGETNVLKEQIAAIEELEGVHGDSLAKLEQNLAAREEALQKAKEEVSRYEERLGELSEAQKQADESLGEMKAEINRILEQQQISSETKLACMTENTRLQTELERHQTILEQNQIQRAKLNAQLLQQKTDADSAEARVKEALLALEAAEAAVAEGSSEQKKREESIAQKTIRLRELEGAKNRLNDELIRLHSKLDTLSNLAERYDGFGGAVRKVMEQKKRYPGIHGVIAELMQVESRYETAIETALGGNIQNIITDTTDTAKLLIEFLKESRAGRATFLPLSGIHAKKDEFSEEILKGKGVIGTANSLVNGDPIYKEAFRYLLGRFLVVDTIDHAIALEKKNQYSLRIVTLDGELFQPGGAISGGAFKNNSNLLGRKRELEQLTEAHGAKQAQLKPLLAEMEQLREERDALRRQNEEKKTELQQLLVAHNTARLRLEQVQKDTKELLGSRNLVREELHSVEEALVTEKTSIAQLGEAIAANQSRQDEAQHRAEELAILLEQARDREDKTSAEAVKVLTEYSGFQQNVQYGKETVSRLQLEIHQLERERNSLSEGKKKNTDEANGRREQIASLSEARARLAGEVATLEQVLLEKGQKAEEITKQNKSFFERREQLSSRISKLDQEVFRLNSQKEKLEEQLEAQTHYMWEEYEITYATAKKERDESIDNPTTTRKEIYELKGKIRALGDVNVNAIEEYRETKERYDFLCGQKEDIRAAEQSLLNIISQLEVQMRKQFVETFEEVKKRFDQVFRELFGGGKGTLALMEEEDVLEAGILVNAQPPGKKLQNMMQLSGGEKALTAISLLFAILDLKPSPFCLLDEIEAALDDSNVSRFAQYLHKLTKDTQFIVITHRRGTMAAADALYGITMQEKGVSTLVSVSLLEGQLEE